MAFDDVRELVETRRWGTAHDFCENRSLLEPSSCEWPLYQGVIAEESGDAKSAEAFYRKAYLLETDTKRHAPFLKSIHSCLYRLEKTSLRLKKLKFVSCLDPEDSDLLRFIAENEPAYRGGPSADVVFFTGTLARKPFSPDSLAREGLGGSETAFVRMAQKLHERGLRVVCFCPTPAAKVYAGVAYFPIQDFYAYGYVRPYPLLVSSRYLYPILQHRVKCRQVVWLHDMGLTMGEDLTPHVSKIERVLVLSDYQKEFVKELYRIPEDLFFKTRNGFVTEDFEFPGPARFSHKLLYMSRPERGLKEAVRVFEKLKARYADAELHVCTYTNEKKLEDDPQLRPLLPALQKEGVVFHGSLKKRDLYRLLHECAILLYPNVSSSETSCIAAIEAMAAGVPVISSDRGALPETLGVPAPNAGGTVVPYAEDPEALIDSLAQAVSRLFEAPGAWEILSRNARIRAHREYTWDVVTDAWLSWIRHSENIT